MRLKVSRKDIPSSHDVGVFIHNEFFRWLKTLENKILVSIVIIASVLTCLFSTHGTTASTWQDLSNRRWMVSRYHKSVLSRDDSALD
jgi:hypothetical protein